jgi:hypothetical protein
VLATKFVPAPFVWVLFGLSFPSQGPTGIQDVPRNLSDLRRHDLISREFGRQSLQYALTKAGGYFIAPPIVTVAPINPVTPKNEV